ncbi:MAG: phospholipid-binding protein [Spirochaetes bacterium GWB1_59_5]|nr:MAG: phospholipid-binding protein [Spirochaetes bacterium GWB1_59_5]
MAVICVAREFAALGDETVHELAKMSGYKPIDKEYIETKMTERGISPEVRAKYDEKKPGFWASLSQDRDDYLHFLKAVLFEEAANGDCIISGRGGFAIFAGVPGVLCIKLVAPRDKRLERVRTRFQCDDKRAEQLLRQNDHDRRGFHDYFFGVNWDDPVYYDLTINTGREHPATVARIIDQLRTLVITPEKEKACMTRMAELKLGQAIITEIVYTRRVPVHFVEADVKGAKVTLHGVANTQSAIDAAAAAAKAVPGIDLVENAIQIVQEFAVMP